MKRHILLALLIVLATVSFAAAGETDWTVHIKVSVPDSRGADGTVWNHLIAGIRDGATDGFDRGWDTLSMAEIDDPVQSMFVHGTIPEDNNSDGSIDNWACSGQENGYSDYECSLWRDIRNPGAEKVWTFQVLSTVNSGTVSFKWFFDNKPNDIDIVLSDLSGSAVNNIDMKVSNTYSYTNTFDSGKKYGIRHFEIRMKVKGFFMVPPDLPDATLGNSYDKKLIVVGSAHVWSLVSGNIPLGMTLDVNTGELTGVPTEVGIFKFTLKADDLSTGFSKTREYTLSINSLPGIESLNLPDGILGSYYNGQVIVTGGSEPFAWSVIGNLPEGLELDNKSGIISGTGIVPGIYNFTVIIKDANGVSDSMDYQVTMVEPEDKTPPDTITDLRVAHATNSSVLLIWSAPLDDSMVHTAAVYDIRYIENCSNPNELNDSTWVNAMDVNGEPRPQSGALQTYTLTGVKIGISYCIAIKSMDAMGHVSAVSNIVTLPLSPDFKMSDISELTSTIVLNKGYNLISIPLIPILSERESLFSFIVGSPVALYRWYSAYPGITQPQYYLENIVQPGAGYFLYSPADNVKLVVDGLEIKDSSRTIELQNGWNMIGNPYTKSILLSDIYVRNVGSFEEKTYPDAVKAGWIGNSVYQLKDGNYDFSSFNDDPPAVLDPWVGYWIKINEKDGVEIIFRRPAN